MTASATSTTCRTLPIAAPHEKPAKSQAVTCSGSISPNSGCRRGPRDDTLFVRQGHEAPAPRRPEQARPFLHQAIGQMVQLALTHAAARGLCFCGSAVDQRTATALQRSERLIGRNRCQDLEVVQRVFDPAGDFTPSRQMSRMTRLSSRSQPSFVIKIVDLYLAQLGDDPVGVVAAGRPDRF